MAKNDFVGISIDGLPETQRIITNWPQEAKDAASRAAAEYLVERFKAQPSQKYVTRRRAYGVTFFSEKQRKWFFAALRSGEISVPYNRTQGMRNSWQIIGRGEDIIIANETQAAVYTMGDDTQSRHEKLVGWKTVGQHLKEGSGKLQKRMQAAGEKALKKLGAK